jgi:hypothetical protein
MIVYLSPLDPKEDLSMKRIFELTVTIIFLTQTFVSSCFATGEVPVPKQEMKYDYSGPYKDLIGMWIGNLKAPEKSHFTRSSLASTNWDFSLYIISAIEQKATGIYCWSAVGNVVPDCREVVGTIDTGADKVLFQWGERTLTLSMKEKVKGYYQVMYKNAGGEQFEGLAKKNEQ